MTTKPSRLTTADGRPLYKLRHSGKAGGFAITVPGEIAKMIPRDTFFAFELTDDGFAYSLVRSLNEDGLPEWLMDIASDEQPQTSDDE